MIGQNPSGLLVFFFEKKKRADHLMQEGAARIYSLPNAPQTLRGILLLYQQNARLVVIRMENADKKHL